MLKKYNGVLCHWVLQKNKGAAVDFAKGNYDDAMPPKKIAPCINTLIMPTAIVAALLTLIPCARPLHTPATAQRRCRLARLAWHLPVNLGK